MPGGVIFFVCIPTAAFERRMLFSTVKNHCNDESSVGKRLNLRAKASAAKLPNESIAMNDDRAVNEVSGNENYNNVRGCGPSVPYGEFNSDSFVSMEIILDHLLKKLKIEHVVWYKDRANKYYEVIFPVDSGDPCETCLLSLMEYGIGQRMNSIVSVLQTQFTLKGLAGANDESRENHHSISDKRDRTWKDFVASIRSKLTVKQVVDGIRDGSELTFDYVLLILTADCLAALGLIENSATNIVAAMLVSPLMGPVMSLTFGAMIADKELQCIGIGSLLVGMLLSIAFGFVFGLLVGTTKMPWGSNDWPTEEMKGRGNYRSLWMGVLWALPSGTGVAIALLQGSNGPMIGVAISASLLPPVVNCGLFWALSCTWLIYKPVEVPYTKEDRLHNGSSYVHVYSDYLPLEFFYNGVISACLTLVNVICIFITAIVVLKIKEVAACYTSTLELRRFWEHDISLVRRTNASRSSSSSASSAHKHMRLEDQSRFKKSLNEVISEVVNDATFCKVQRLSYGQYKNDQTIPLLRKRLANGEADCESKSSREPLDLSVEDELEMLEKEINQFFNNQDDRNLHKRRCSMLRRNCARPSNFEYMQLLDTNNGTNLTRT